MLIPPVSDSDHQLGPKDASIILVEYGDFECPYCGEAYFSVESVMNKMQDNLRFVFRNFPLRDIHPFAEDAAEASEAAGVQNKFWEMYNKLFQNQQHLTVNDLIRYGVELGMKGEQLQKDLENHTYEQKINQQLLGGEKSGVEGTPTFFINGTLYTGSYEEDPLLSYLQTQ